MGGSFIQTVKFGLLFVIAFAVPKMITESGRYLKNLDKINAENDANSETKSNGFALNETNRVGIRSGSSGFSTDSATISPRFEANSSFVSSESPPEQETSRTFPNVSITPLDEIVRFDRTPDWIVERWSRVDSVLSSIPLRGYRVAILTGSQRDDLSGVLTYFFDDRQARRITFVGQTGDYSKILRFLERRFGMVRQTETSSPGEFVYEATLALPERQNQSNATEKSRLFIRPTQAFIAERPNDRFEVEFLLNAP